MKVKILICLLSIGLISCGNRTISSLNSSEIQIQWVNNLLIDFSFKDNWSYSEGIFRNEFGQLSCDGICPPEIDNMKDDKGQIFADSLKAFYNLVDTTHFFHTINSETNAYEWVGTDFISVKRINKDSVICFTQNNAATHSSLHLVIVGNFVKPMIILKSINFSSREIIYECLGGEILIEKKMWQKGILKASFCFDFENKENINKPIYWNGKIYSEIR